MKRENRALELVGETALARLVRDEARAPAELRRVFQALRHPEAIWGERRRAWIEAALGPEAWRINTFSAALGKPLMAYLAELRVVGVPHVLRETDLTVRQLSQLLGYGEPAAFRKAVHRIFGQSPQALRAAERAAVPPVAPDLRSFQRRYAEELLVLLPSLEPAEQENLLRLGVPVAAEELFAALSVRSRKEGRNDRQAGVRWAELALAVVEGNALMLGARASVLHALAHARLGNARRLASDLDGAEAAFHEAEVILAESTLREPRAAAEIQALRGTLNLFRRRFSAALAALAEALELAREAGDAALQVDVLVQRAAAWYHCFDPRAMVLDLNTAQEVLARDLPHDLSRHYYVQHDLALAHIEAEQWEMAAKLLPQAKQLADEAEHAVGRVQLDLAEGLLLRGQGRLDEAEHLLREVRSRFAALEDIGTASVVTLDLALVCQQQGRFAEVRALVEEVLELLESLRLEGEALAAWQLLQQAAVDEAITQTMLHEARRRLRITTLIDPQI